MLDLISHLTIASLMKSISQPWSAAKFQGKQARLKNLHLLEDVSITKAYKEITMDASVGVDQDSDVYYNKIAERFTQLMGDSKVQSRQMSAIRNRWTISIQKALLKFSACINKTIAEYHSGWNLEDYITCAKKSAPNFLAPLLFFRQYHLPKNCPTAES